MIVRTPTCGTCMGPWMENVTAVIDTQAPVASGDLVRVLVRNQKSGTIFSLIKLLETTSDGKWWLSCLEGVNPIGGYFVPAAIEKVIEREPTFCANADFSQWAGASRAVIEQWDKLSLAARAEWTQPGGKRRGVPFPGIEAALAVGVPPTHWPESFRLPRNFYGEEAA